MLLRGDLLEIVRDEVSAPQKTPGFVELGVQSVDHSFTQMQFKWLHHFDPSVFLPLPLNCRAVKLANALQQRHTLVLVTLHSMLFGLD